MLLGGLSAAGDPKEAPRTTGQIRYGNLDSTFSGLQSASEKSELAISGNASLPLESIPLL